MMGKEIQIIKNLLCRAVLVPILSLSLFYNGFSYWYFGIASPITLDECAIGAGSWRSPLAIDPFRIYSTKADVAPNASNAALKCPVRVELKHFSSFMAGAAMFMIAVLVNMFEMFAVLLFFAQFEDGRAYIENWKKKASWLALKRSSG